MKRPSNTFWLLLVVLIPLTTWLCWKWFDYRIHYILPNGYHGIVKVVIDDSNGVSPKRSKGRYVYVVPEDGILTSAKNYPFLRSYSMTAQYSDGSEIPNGFDASSSEVALRRLFNDKDKVLWLLVGTESEAQNAKTLRREK